MGEIINLYKGKILVTDCEYFRIDHFFESDKEQQAVIKSKIGGLRAEDIFFVIVNCFDCDIHQVNINHHVNGQIAVLQTIPELI